MYLLSVFHFCPQVPPANKKENKRRLNASSCDLNLKQYNANVSQSKEISSDEMTLVYPVTTGARWGTIWWSVGMWHRHTPGKSMPRFEPVGNKRFVQILNVGDHWICVTNIFSSTTHYVYIFDSLYQTGKTNTVPQLTSLLRTEYTPDFITYDVRRFHQQTETNRLCGFYAIAASFACCLGINLGIPTAALFDETILSKHLYDCFQNNKVEAFPCVFLRCSSVRSG